MHQYMLLIHSTPGSSEAYSEDERDARHGVIEVRLVVVRDAEVEA